MVHCIAPLPLWAPVAVVAAFAAPLAFSLPGSDDYLAGDAAARAGRHAEAVEAFSRCAGLTGSPLEPYARLRIARSRMDAGDVEGGSAAIAAFLADCPPGPWVAKAEAELALALCAAGRSREAAPRFARAFGDARYLAWMYPYMWAAAEAYTAEPAHAERGWQTYERMLPRARTRDDRLIAARALARAPHVGLRLLSLETFVAAGEREAADSAVASLDRTSLSPDLRARLLLAEGSLLLLRDDAPGALNAFLAAEHTAGVSTEWVRKAQAARVRCMLTEHDPRPGEVALERFAAESAGSNELGDLLLWWAGRLAEGETIDRAVATWRRIVALCPDYPSADVALMRAADAIRGRSSAQAATEAYLLLASTYPRSRLAPEAQWRAGRLLETMGDIPRALSAYEGAASGPLGSYYAHRALERLESMGRSDVVGPALRVDGVAVPVRPRAGREAPAVTVPEAWTQSDWLARLRFFGAHGLDEIEWEAQQLLPALDGGPVAGALLHALSTAGASRTAMALAEYLRFDESADGEPGLSRERIRHPLVHWREVAAIARETRTDPLLLLAIARQESLFQARAVSRAGAVGLLQLMPSTADWLATVDSAIPPETLKDLGHPRNSLRLGAHYLRRMLNQFDGDVTLALAAYNGGPGNVRKWRRAHPATDMDAFIDAIPFSETRDYVKKVLGNYAAYHSLYPAPDRLVDSAFL